MDQLIKTKLVEGDKGVSPGLKEKNRNKTEADRGWRLAGAGLAGTAHPAVSAVVSRRGCRGRSSEAVEGNRSGSEAVIRELVEIRQVERSIGPTMVGESSGTASRREWRSEVARCGGR